MSVRTYFERAAKLQKIGTWLFWANGALTLGLIFAKSTPFEAWLAMPLVALVAASLCISLWSRCLINDGNSAQRAAQFADAFGVSCEHPAREGYYNSSLMPGPRRLLAITCESAGLTKEILEAMLTEHLFRLISFVLIFLAYVGYAKADISILAVIAQTLFSSDLIGNAVSLQRFLNKVKRVHQTLIQFFRTQLDTDNREALAIGLAAHVDYECAKEESAILLDSKIYEQKNPEYTDRWNRMRVELKIDAQLDRSRGSLALEEPPKPAKEIGNLES